MKGSGKMINDLLVNDMLKSLINGFLTGILMLITFAIYYILVFVI